MLYELIVAGGLVFWAIILLESVILTAFIENERYGNGFGCLVVFAFLLLCFCGDLTPWIVAVRDNPLWLFAGIVVYACIGAAYMLFRWRLFVGDANVAYHKLKDNGFSNQGWTDSYGRSAKIGKPKPSDYQSRLIGWAAYWPPSLFWWLLSDPFQRLGQWIYYRFAGLLQRIADSAWSELP